MENSININEIVKQIGMQEEVIKNVAKITPIEFMAPIAGGIINTRMFLYFNEKILRKQINGNPTKYFYDYINSIIKNKENNYRNLVLFEIDELLDHIKVPVNKNDIENSYLGEFCTALIRSHIYLLNKRNIQVREYNNEHCDSVLYEIGDFAPQDKYRITFLLGCLAHMNNFERMEYIESLVLYGNESEKQKDLILNNFYNFVDYFIEKYSHYDFEVYLILIAILAIRSEYIFKFIEE